MYKLLNIMENIIQKVCKKHGLTDYAYVVSENRYRCKKCMNNYVTEKRRRLKEALVKYKGGKCEICGYNKCINALEFHHLNPNEKEFGLSNGNIKSLERLKKEVEKCILVCSNCHHEIHYADKMAKFEEERKIEEENEHNYFKLCKLYESKPSNNVKIQLNKEIIEEQLKTYKQGEIAKMNNCSLATLKRFLKENGLTNEKEKHKMKYITVNEFIDLFKKHNYKKTLVAKELGVKTLALNEFCQRNNIPWHKEQMKEYMEGYGK